jgi:hypothetical protein
MQLYQAVAPQLRENTDHYHFSLIEPVQASLKDKGISRKNSGR